MGGGACTAGGSAGRAGEGASRACGDGAQGQQVGVQVGGGGGGAAHSRWGAGMAGEGVRVWQVRVRVGQVRDEVQAQQVRKRMESGIRCHLWGTQNTPESDMSYSGFDLRCGLSSFAHHPSGIKLHAS